MLRRVSGSLAIVFIFTNVLFAYQPEKSVWEERQKQVQLASLVIPAKVRHGGSVLWRTGIQPVNLSPNTSKFPIKTFGNDGRAVAGFPAGLQAHVRFEERFEGSTSKKRVLLLQDIHQNKEAQKHLSGVLNALVQEGKEKEILVGLEGAEGELPYDLYRQFEGPALGNAVADSFFKTGELTGPVYTALTTYPKPGQTYLDFRGVDDGSLYAQNVQAYKSAHATQAAVLKRLQAEREKIQKEKKAVYSSALKTFDARVEVYRSGELSLADYLPLLSRGERQSATVAVFLDASRLEKNMDFQRVEVERAYVLEKLTRALDKGELEDLIARSVLVQNGEETHASYYEFFNNVCLNHKINLNKTPTFNNYVHYVLLSGKIQPNVLFAESRQLEEKTFATLSKNEAERSLIKRDRRLFLTQKLLDFSLTPEEWNEYKQTGHTKHLSSFESFYELAIARNEKMVNNILAPLENRQSKLLVLVAGGFHTEGITRLLRERQISYVVAVPKLTTVDTAEGSAYLSVFDREKTPIEQIFSGRKLFLSDNPSRSFLTIVLNRIAFEAARFGVLSSSSKFAAARVLGSTTSIDVVKKKTGAVVTLRGAFGKLQAFVGTRVPLVTRLFSKQAASTREIESTPVEWRTDLAPLLVFKNIVAAGILSIGITAITHSNFWGALAGVVLGAVVHEMGHAVAIRMRTNEWPEFALNGRSIGVRPADHQGLTETDILAGPLTAVFFAPFLLAIGTPFAFNLFIGAVVLNVLALVWGDGEALRAQRLPEREPKFLGWGVNRKWLEGNRHKVVPVFISGGEGAGVNDYFAHVARELRNQGLIPVAVQNGIQGFVGDELEKRLVVIDEELEKQFVGRGGSLAGTSRVDVLKMNEEKLSRVIKNMSGFRAYLAIGGGDHALTWPKLANQIKTAEVSPDLKRAVEEILARMIVVYKTIDGDTWGQPLGYYTAIRRAQEIIYGAAASGEAMNKVTVVGMMGADVGMLALQAASRRPVNLAYLKTSPVPEERALARQIEADGDQVLILLPEQENISLQEVVEGARRIKTAWGSATIVVAEGFRIDEEDPMLKQLIDEQGKYYDIDAHTAWKKALRAPRDPHGNIKRAEIPVEIIVTAALRHYINEVKIEDIRVAEKIGYGALRGANPTHYDRVYPRLLARRVANLIQDKHFGVVVSLPPNDMSIDDAFIRRFQRPALLEWGMRLWIFLRHFRSLGLEDQVFEEIWKERKIRTESFHEVFQIKQERGLYNVLQARTLISLRDEGVLLKGQSYHVTLKRLAESRWQAVSELAGEKPHVFEVVEAQEALPLLTKHRERFLDLYGKVHQRASGEFILTNLFRRPLKNHHIRLLFDAESKELIGFYSITINPGEENWATPLLDTLVVDDGRRRYRLHGEALPQGHPLRDLSSEGPSYRGSGAVNVLFEDMKRLLAEYFPGLEGGPIVNALIGREKVTNGTEPKDFYGTLQKIAEELRIQSVVDIHDEGASPVHRSIPDRLGLALPFLLISAVGIEEMYLTSSISALPIVILAAIGSAVFLWQALWLIQALLGHTHKYGVIKGASEFPSSPSFYGSAAAMINGVIHINKMLFAHLSPPQQQSILNEELRHVRYQQKHKLLFVKNRSWLSRYAEELFVNVALPFVELFWRPTQLISFVSTDHFSKSDWQMHLRWSIEVLAASSRYREKIVALEKAIRSSGKKEEVIYKLLEAEYRFHSEPAVRRAVVHLLENLGFFDALRGEIDLNFGDKTPSGTLAQSGSFTKEAAFKIAMATYARFYEESRAPGIQAKDDIDDFAESVLLQMAKKFDKKLVFFAAEGAGGDELGTRLGASHVINPDAKGGVLFVLVDVIEGTNAASTNNNGRPRERLTPSDAGAVVIITEGDRVWSALGGAPTMDLYTDTLFTTIPPHVRDEFGDIDPVFEGNPYILLQRIAEANHRTIPELTVKVLGRPRERARLKALLPGVFPEVIDEMTAWCEKNHSPLLVKDPKTGLLVEIISDGTFIHALQAIIGHNPNWEKTFVPSYYYNDLPENFRDFIADPNEVSLQNAHPILWTSGKSSEGFSDLAIGLALAEKRGTEGGIAFYSKEVQYASDEDRDKPGKQRRKADDLSRRYEFESSQTSSEGLNGTPINEVEWLDENRPHDATRIKSGRARFTTRLQRGRPGLHHATIFFTDNGVTGAKGVGKLADGRFYATGVFIEETQTGGVHIYPDAFVDSNPLAIMQGQEEVALPSLSDADRKIKSLDNVIVRFMSDPDVNSTFAGKTAENLTRWLHPLYAEDHGWILSLLQKIKSGGEDEKKAAIKELNDSFFQSLAPGTAGMRGTRGRGANRVNKFTVGRFTLALARYYGTDAYKEEVRKFDPEFNPEEGYASVIARDPREGGEEIMMRASLLKLAEGGFNQIYVYPEPRSTPQLSWSVQSLYGRVKNVAYRIITGDVVTASHNPRSDNGIKPYNPDGAQVLGAIANGIIEANGAITADDMLAAHYHGIPLFGTFADLKKAYDLAIANNQIVMLEQDADQAFMTEQSHESFNSRDDGSFDPAKVDVSAFQFYISPLNGVGRQALELLLKKRGISEDQITWAQDEPRGDFRDIPNGKPNPELDETRQVLINRVLQDANQLKAQGRIPVLLWLDPDADRPAVAMPRSRSPGIPVDYQKAADFVSFNGNQQLALSADFFVRQIGKREHSRFWQASKLFATTTVVSGFLMKVIFRAAHIPVYETLVGFKNIGAVVENSTRMGLQLGGLSKRAYLSLSRPQRLQYMLTHSLWHLFGGEESLGSATGDSTHDKNAITGAVWFVEMIGELKKQGKLLDQRMTEIYQQYGYLSEPPMLDFAQTYVDEEGNTESFSEAEANGIIGKADNAGNEPENVEVSILGRLRRDVGHGIGDIAAKRIAAIVDFRSQEARNLRGEILFSATSGQKGFFNDIAQGMYSFVHPDGEVLDKENFVMVVFEDGSIIAARPSGTEPKIKIYVLGRGDYKDKEILDQWTLDAQAWFRKFTLNIVKERFPNAFSKPIVPGGISNAFSFMFLLPALKSGFSYHERHSPPLLKFHLFEWSFGIVLGAIVVYAAVKMVMWLRRGIHSANDPAPLARGFAVGIGQAIKAYHAADKSNRLSKRADIESLLAPVARLGVSELSQKLVGSREQRRPVAFDIYMEYVSTPRSTPLELTERIKVGDVNLIVPGPGSKKEVEAILDDFLGKNVPTEGENKVLLSPEIYAMHVEEWNSRPEYLEAFEFFNMNDLGDLKSLVKNKNNGVPRQVNMLFQKPNAVPQDLFEALRNLNEDPEFSRLAIVLYYLKEGFSQAAFVFDLENMMQFVNIIDSQA